MSVTIQYCSDLHLEFELNRKRIAKYPLEVKGDILLLAGDVTPFAQMEQHHAFFDFAAQNYKATYWIPGNHEYYGADIAMRGQSFNEAIRDNVFLLNNTSVSLDDITLICSTLWSHISPANEWEITRAMSDFHLIRNGAGKLDIPAYNELHATCLKFIKEAVRKAGTKKKVVMTHHVPTFMNYPEKYRSSVLNEAFTTELHDYIENSGINFWLYGHTHSNTPDFKIGNTKLLTNQFGYVQHGENKHFNNAKVFTI